jgi:hypothetical protein
MPGVYTPGCAIQPLMGLESDRSERLTAFDSGRLHAGRYDSPP